MPGSPSTFDEFYAEHFTDLAVQLYAYLGDLSTAETLTHEAFSRALARWRAINRVDQPTTWVRRTAWALASRWRSSAAGTTTATSDTRAPSPEQAAYLLTLAGMPARPRRVFVLYHLAALPLADIADQERLRLAKVRAALQQAQSHFAATAIKEPVTPSAH